MSWPPQLTRLSRFEELERKFIGDSTPNWRWCLSSGCDAGQIHISLPTSKSMPNPPAKPSKRSKKRNPPIDVYQDPLTASSPVSDICTCVKCGAKACVSCDRPWHEGETCEQYQLRIKDHVEEEDKALKRIRDSTRPCPQCGKRIEKNGGCPSMHCTQCGIAFCWNCNTAFSNQGS
jgi:hypothetical protein